MLAFLGQEHKHFPFFQITETAARYCGYQITESESTRKSRQVSMRGLQQVSGNWRIKVLICISCFNTNNLRVYSAQDILHIRNVQVYHTVYRVQNYWTQSRQDASPSAPHQCDTQPSKYSSSRSCSSSCYCRHQLFSALPNPPWSQTAAALLFRSCMHAPSSTSAAQLWSALFFLFLNWVVSWWTFTRN